jgi:uncharacterized protein involved in oxidation of intracellular sulfur
MDSLTIIINGAPYGNEQVWNALRLAQASLSSAVGMSINLFLIGDAVTVAKKGQEPPEGYYNLEKMLHDLVIDGAKIAACGTYLNSRGLSEEDLLEGVEASSMVMLAKWIKEISKAITF